MRIGLDPLSWAHLMFPHLGGVGMFDSLMPLNP